MVQEISWEITNECNLRCIYCLPMSGAPRAYELTTAEVFSALDTFRGGGVERICFTGGEPFCRNDFVEIVEYAHKEGFQTSVITNGTMIDKKTLLRFKKLGVDLAVSLDGSCKEKNDFIRGEGTFEKVMHFLTLCRECDVFVDIYMTVHSQNITEIVKVGELARKYMYKGFHVKEINIEGKAQYAPYLWIEKSDRDNMASEIMRLIEKIFNEEVVYTDSQCWADGTTLFVAANGNIYPCVEVFSKRPELALGNIRNCNLDRICEYIASRSKNDLLCSYMTKMSASVTAMQNVYHACPLAPSIDEEIGDLKELYTRLDSLFANIEFFCRYCEFPACMGNLWLLKEEADTLYNRGVPIVEINGIDLIHVYGESSDGSVNVSLDHPQCIEFDQNTRTCAIYEQRPLICRFYPVGLETTSDGDVVWGLHTDCLFYRELEQMEIVSPFTERASKLIDGIDPHLLEEIVGIYKKIHELYMFPHGENKYVILKCAEGDGCRKDGR